MFAVKGIATQAIRRSEYLLVHYVCTVKANLRQNTETALQWIFGVSLGDGVF